MRCRGLSKKKEASNHIESGGRAFLAEGTANECNGSKVGNVLYPRKLEKGQYSWSLWATVRVRREAGSALVRLAGEEGKYLDFMLSTRGRVACSGLHFQSSHCLLYVRNCRSGSRKVG